MKPKKIETKKKIAKKEPEKKKKRKRSYDRNDKYIDWFSDHSIGTF
jgi:hypothetical protein